MSFIEDIYTNSPEETEEVGRWIAEKIDENPEYYTSGSNIFIALYGDVGEGKTVFTRGLVSYFAPDENVHSPTYTVVNEYNGKRKIYHFDMYRIKDGDDLESTGFYDYESAVIIAEWCENIPFALPKTYLKVTLKKTDFENGRRISIERVSKNEHCCH